MKYISLILVALALPFFACSCNKRDDAELYKNDSTQNEITDRVGTVRSDGVVIVDIIEEIDNPDEQDINFYHEMEGLWEIADDYKPSEDDPLFGVTSFLLESITEKITIYRDVASDQVLDCVADIHGLHIYNTDGEKITTLTYNGEGFIGADGKIIYARKMYIEEYYAKNQ